MTELSRCGNTGHAVHRMALHRPNARLVRAELKALLVVALHDVEDFVQGVLSRRWLTVANDVAQRRTVDLRQHDFERHPAVVRDVDAEVARLVPQQLGEQLRQRLDRLLRVRDRRSDGCCARRRTRRRPGRGTHAANYFVAASGTWPPACVCATSEGRSQSRHSRLQGLAVRG